MKILSKETIMTEITKFLRLSKFTLSKRFKDGRNNSVSDEDIIIKIISESQKFQEVLKKYNLKLLVPKERHWYDIAIVSEVPQNDLFIPINIKSSTLKHADNINSKLGLFYACTGIRPETLGLSDGCGWVPFYELLEKHMDSNINCDYYFLIINKNNVSDIFWTSMKQLSKTTPNGSNWPFQCNWSKNRDLVHRTHYEARKFILNAFNDSRNKDHRHNGFKRLEKFL